MKKRLKEMFLVIIAVCFFIAITSCEKETDLTDLTTKTDSLLLLVKANAKPIPTVDFGYGIDFSTSGSYNYLSATDASTSIPSDSKYSWIFDGSSVSSLKNFKSNEFSKRNGTHTLGLTITTPDGFTYSKSKVFQIINNTVISADFPADTSKKQMPVADFGYSVLFSYMENYLSTTDASTSIPIDSKYSWTLDGNFISSLTYFESQSFSTIDGTHTLGLKITTPDGNSYSKSKVFQIKNNTVISSDFPADTSKNQIPVVDFGYGIDFLSSSFNNYLSATDASTSIPKDSKYSWIFDGSIVSTSTYFKSQSFSKIDGTHTLGLKITTPDGISYSKSKVFQISNNSVISSDFPADTSKKSMPVVDFSYSISYSNDSTYVTIGYSDASSNVGNSSYNSYWYINGERISNGTYDYKNNSVTKNSNGQYSITHEIVVNGVKYSKYKEFDITGIK